MTPIDVEVVERNVARGERPVGSVRLFEGDTLSLNDNVARGGGPAPIVLEYLPDGRLRVTVWSEP